MALLDYDEATARAIVTALQAGLDAATSAGAVSVVLGWPDAQAAQPQGPAIVAVTYGEATETPINPTIYNETEDDGAIEVLDIVARWELSVQVDLFASYRDQRAELAPVIRQILSPGVAHPKLALTLTDYHDLVVLLMVDSVGDVDDEDAMVAREWRRTWQCTARGKVLTGRTLVPLDDNRTTLTAARDIDI